MTSISLSSLRALGCVRSRLRTPAIPILQRIASRPYAQLAPKQDVEEHDIPDDSNVQQSQQGVNHSREKYGREFVHRHLPAVPELVTDRPSSPDSSCNPTLPDASHQPRKTLSASAVDAAAGNTNISVTGTTVTPRVYQKRRRALYRPVPNVTSGSSTNVSTPARLQPSENHDLAQKLISILTSKTAIAKPSDALNQAIAYHRGNASHSSVETFNILLAFAARTRNYCALRRVLHDMQAGNVQWNDSTRTFVLKAVLQHPGTPEVSSDVDKSPTGRSTPDASPRIDPQTGIHKKKLQGRTGLIKRLEATSSAVADQYRQAVLNGGRWTHQKVSTDGHPHAERTTSDTSSTRTYSPFLKSPPAMRIGVLQNAPAPDKARSQLPPHDSQLSPSLFLAFLRYMLACSSNPPSLADSYQALLALDTAERRVTSDHLLHLTHLYLHPSLYTYQGPYMVITDMRTFTRNGPCAFKPNSETLQKALYSLRLRQQRARTARNLVRMFQRLWGESIVDLTCWRIVGRYGLELNDIRVQAFALKGGIAAHRRDRVEARKSSEARSLENLDNTQSSEPVTRHALADPFQRHGTERKKWAEVRKAIIGRIRLARSLVKEREEAESLTERVEESTGKVEISIEKEAKSTEKVAMSTEKDEKSMKEVETPTEKSEMAPENVETSTRKPSILLE